MLSGSNNLSLKDKVNYVLFFSIPLISLVMIEFAARDSLISTIAWPLAEPFAFLASAVLFYAVYIFLWANIYYQGITALVYSIIFIIISCITGCKREVLGIPFMPWDIKSGGSFSELLGQSESVSAKISYKLDFYPACGSKYFCDCYDLPASYGKIL